MLTKNAYRLSRDSFPSFDRVGDDVEPRSCPFKSRDVID